MDDLAQMAQFAGFYFLLLLITVYLSVSVAVDLGRLATDLPWPLSIVAVRCRSHGGATLGGATIGTILLCLFHLPPVVYLVWPSNYISILARLDSLLLFGAEAVWFAYLRRYLVRAKG